MESMEHSDVKVLLEDLLEAEQMAIKIYAEILSTTKDEKIRETMKGIAEDESKHANNAREMLRIAGYE